MCQLNSKVNCFKKKKSINLILTGGGVNLIPPPPPHPYKIFRCLATATYCDAPFHYFFLWSLAHLWDHKAVWVRSCYKWPHILQTWSCIPTQYSSRTSDVWSLASISTNTLIYWGEICIVRIGNHAQKKNSPHILKINAVDEKFVPSLHDAIKWASLRLYFKLELLVKHNTLDWEDYNAPPSFETQLWALNGKLLSH